MPRNDHYAPILKNWIYPFSQMVRGRNYLAMLRDASRFQKLSREEIRDIQFKKLKRMLQHAWESIPHYRDVFNKTGIKPQDIRTFEDLQLIPTISKADILEAPQSFISSNPRTRAVTLRTSGTSGQQMAFQLDQSTITAEDLLEKREGETFEIAHGSHIYAFKEAPHFPPDPRHVTDGAPLHEFLFLPVGYDVYPIGFYILGRELRDHLIRPKPHGDREAEAIGYARLYLARDLIGVPRRGGRSCKV